MTHSRTRLTSKTFDAASVISWTRCRNWWRTFELKPTEYRGRDQWSRPRPCGKDAAAKVSHVDVIVCGGEAAARAARAATRTIPLVVLVDDALRAGLVRSLAEPGGNTTGVSILASELDGKRQDSLIEAVPRASPYGGPLDRSRLDAAAQAEGACTIRRGARRRAFYPSSHQT